MEIASHLVKVAHLLRSSILFGDLVFGACVMEGIQDTDAVRRAIAGNPTVTSKLTLVEGESIDASIFDVIATADGAQSLENDLRFIIAGLKKEGKVTTDA